MTIGRLARNVILVAVAWRLIARRRDALARERRARRIAPLLITAGGTGLILTARPRMLEGLRRLWDATRRQSNGKTSSVASEPQRAVGESPAGGTQRVVAPPGKARRGQSLGGEQQPLARAKSQPKPRVKKRPRAEQDEKGRRRSAFTVKAEAEQGSGPGAELEESLKH